MTGIQKRVFSLSPIQVDINFVLNYKYAEFLIKTKPEAWTSPLITVDQNRVYSMNLKCLHGIHFNSVQFK